MLVAGGFIGGVQVQKDQGDGGSGRRSGRPAASRRAWPRRRRRRRRRRGAAAGRRGRTGGGLRATVGTVANVKGSTLYVTDSDGTTVKVKTDEKSKVTRNAASSAGAVHPGDTVVIQGAKTTNGTVTARDHRDRQGRQRRRLRRGSGGGGRGGTAGRRRAQSGGRAPGAPGLHPAVG